MKSILFLVALLIFSTYSLADNTAGPIREIHLETTKFGSWYNSIAYSPDGKILAVSGNKNQIIFFNSSNGEKLKNLKGHSGHINSLDFSPNGKFLVSGDSASSIIIWDLNGDILKKIEISENLSGKDFEKEIIAIKYSPDNRNIAVASRNDVILIDGFSGQIVLQKEFFEKKTYECKGNISEEIKSERVSSLSFNNKGTRLAIGTKKTIYILDLETNKIIKKFDKGNLGYEHAETITSISYSPNNERIFSYAFDHSTIMWKTEEAKQIWKTINSNPITSIINAEYSKCSVCHIPHDAKSEFSIGMTVGSTSAVFSPNGKYIATGSKEIALTIRDAETGKRIKTFPLFPESSASSISFNPKENEVAAYISYDVGGKDKYEIKESVFIFKLNWDGGPKSDFENEILNLIDDRDTNINLIYSLQTEKNNEGKYVLRKDSTAAAEEARLMKEYDALIEKEKKTFEEKYKMPAPEVTDLRKPQDKTPQP